MDTANLRALTDAALAAGRKGEPSTLQAEAQAACLLGRGAAAAGCVATSGIQAERRGAGWLLSGFAPAALLTSAAGEARDCVLLADSAEGRAVFVLPAGTPGLKVDPVQSLDGLPAVDVRLEVAAVAQAAVHPLPDDALAPARLALAAEIMGAAETALDIGAARAREHKLFGKAVGSYQVQAHRFADARIDLESMQLALADALNADPAELGVQALALQLLCAAAGPRIAAIAQQAHGGEGYHADLPLQRYTRRLFGLALRLGGPERVQAELLKRLKPA